MEFKFIEKEDIEEFRKSEWDKFNQEKGYVWDETELWLAAFSGKEILGYAYFSIAGGVGKLIGLIVKKEARGTGVGSKLMDMYEEYCVEKGCHKLTLRTTPEVMESAFLLYKKKGFEIEAELKNDRFNFDDVIMSKRI